MPVFEYVCHDCHEKFEMLVRSSASAPALCPSCGGENTLKLFSTFAVRAGASKGPSAAPQPTSSGGGCCGMGGCGCC